MFNKKIIGAGLVALSFGLGNSAFAENKTKDFHDGMYFGANVGSALTKTRAFDADIPILEKATFFLLPGESQRVKYKKAISYGIFMGWKEGDFRGDVDLRLGQHKFDKLEERQATGNVQDVSFLVDNISLQYTSLSMNGYRDQDLYEYLKPYIGMGLGVSKFKAKAKAIGPLNPLATISNTKLTGQLIVGARVPMTENLHMLADYRYFSSIGKVSAIGSRFSNHSVNLGIMYQPSI